jgi:catechol 2,3-dioxygenase-like lactoylglutathione lyase family enzyme
MANTSFDHCVIAVSDWKRSNDFYARVLRAEVIRLGRGFAYRVGDAQLNVHGSGVEGDPNARPPVVPGGSDLCVEWDGSIDSAVAHLRSQGVAVEVGPVPRFGAGGEGTSVYFRDPDGSLLELISYAAGD